MHLNNLYLHFQLSQQVRLRQHGSIMVLIHACALMLFDQVRFYQATEEEENSSLVGTVVYKKMMIEKTKDHFAQIVPMLTKL